MRSEGTPNFDSKLMCSAPHNVTVKLMSTRNYGVHNPDNLGLSSNMDADSARTFSAATASTFGHAATRNNEHIVLQASTALPLPDATGAQACVHLAGHVGNSLQLEFADSAGNGRFLCLYTLAILVLDSAGETP